MDSGSQGVIVDIIIVNMIVEQDGWQSPEAVVRERAVTAVSGEQSQLSPAEPGSGEPGGCVWPGLRASQDLSRQI